LSLTRVTLRTCFELCSNSFNCLHCMCFSLLLAQGVLGLLRAFKA
jgi:hypothetical protein